MGLFDACKQGNESGSESASEEELIDVAREKPKHKGFFGTDVAEEAPTLGADQRFLFDYDSHVSQGVQQWFTCDPTAQIPCRIAEAGVAASPQLTPLSTLPHQLMLAAKRKGDYPALKAERPCPPVEKDENGVDKAPSLPEDEWATWTHQEFYDDVRKAAGGFRQLGFQPFDSVNIWGFNSPEWVMSALAASCAGGKVAGLYPTDTPDTAAYKVAHSGGSIVVVEDRSKIDKLVKALNARNDRVRRVKAFVAWGYIPGQGETVSLNGANPRNVPIIGWEALMHIGENQLPAIDGIVKEQLSLTTDRRTTVCAALIYTSGTTGEPKAVMISHDNMLFEATAVLNLLKESSVGTQEEQERMLSYLPQSHVAGMLLDIVAPVIGTAQTPAWFTLYFARNYDLKVGTIKERLTTARPTVFLGVPLVWEKIADKIRAIGAANTGIKKAIGDWSKGVMLSHAKNCLMGGPGSYPCGYSLANVVMSKVKAGLGLDQCKFGFTGAAPIRVDTLEYFGSLGLGINEVYGMSECTGACTWSTDQAHQWGSCGFQMPGVEVKAFLVDDRDPSGTTKTECPQSPSIDDVGEKYQGELCFRGRNIMMGYLAQQDLGPAHVQEIQKKTAEAIDRAGWLHSGDKGMVTEQGMVKITGRYKELIIGLGGENIAPVPIEDCVKKSCDGINEVMMVGDKRKYNVALVTLKAKGANGEGPGTDELDAGAKRVNPSITTISGAMDDKVWIEAVTKAITAANNNGKACPNNAFKIQKFCILPTNFSEENGELTPTKKLKRAVVAKSYAALIEKMYNTDGVYIRYS